MELVRGLQGLKPKHLGAAMTVGSFDGIHLGHGGLIASTCGLAKQLARPAMMLTFEPMPREYLAPQDPRLRLNLARALAKSGDKAGARREIGHVVNRDPRAPVKWTVAHDAERFFDLRNGNALNRDRRGSLWVVLP